MRGGGGGELLINEGVGSGPGDANLTGFFHQFNVRIILDPTFLIR